jgi:phosphoribosyl-AMP cyclohydrolase / phosphoribosyl-ATP pyrophosphohydrolase
VSELTFDERGLITAVVQDRLTGEVRMVAWMNQEAVRATLATGKATFFSRSRQALWVKGESSGHVLHVHEVRVDCDGDTLLVLVDPVGPSCHTGRSNCFFTPLEARSLVAAGKPLPETTVGMAEGGATGAVSATDAGAAPAVPAVDALPFLSHLEQEILRRTESEAERSYTRYLLDKGIPKINEKLREEADELCRALESEEVSRVASESADVLYHLLVGLRARGVGLREVIATLAARAGQSGHAEKAARSAGNR